MYALDRADLHDGSVEPNARLGGDLFIPAQTGRLCHICLFHRPLLSLQGPLGANSVPFSPYLIVGTQLTVTAQKGLASAQLIGYPDIICTGNWYH